MQNIARLILTFIFCLFSAVAFSEGDFNSGGIFNKGLLVCDSSGATCTKAKQMNIGTPVDNGDGSVTVSVSSSSYTTDSGWTTDHVSKLYNHSPYNRVGINTTSPGYTLDIDGEILIDSTLYVGGNNVGIGTVSPSTTLDVEAANAVIGINAIPTQGGCDSNAIMLFHFDGNLTDANCDGGGAASATASGGWATSTTSPKFGSASGLASATSDYVTVTSTGLNAVGTGDFAFDFWVKANAGDAGYFFSWRTSGPTLAVEAHVIASGELYVTYVSTTKDTGVFVADGSWHHVVVGRSGGLRMYAVDGVRYTYGTFSDDLDSVNDFYINRYATSNNAKLGYIDEFRASTGDRYPANYTVPALAYDTSTYGQGTPKFVGQVAGTQTFAIYTDGADSNKLKIDVPSTRMTFDTAGNVGINTTSPSATLDVVGPLEVTGTTNLTGTTVMTGDITMSGGNVGIGTTDTSNAMFTVSGSVSMGDLSGSRTWNIDGNGNLSHGGSNGYEVKDNQYAFDYAVGLGVGLQFDATNSNFSFNYLGTPLMTINVGGNVGIGIGTTTPNYKLEVDGVIYGKTGVYAAGTGFIGTSSLITGNSVATRFGTGTLSPTAALDIRDGAVIAGDTTFKSVVGIGQITPAYSLDILRESSTTSSADTIINIAHQTTGTVAANFGSRINWMLEDSAGNNETMAYMDIVADDPTNGSEDSSIRFFTRNAGGAPAEILRLYDGISTGGNILVGRASIDFGSDWTTTGRYWSLQNVNGQTYLLLRPGTSSSYFTKWDQMNTSHATGSQNGIDNYVNWNKDNTSSAFTGTYYAYRYRTRTNLDTSSGNMSAQLYGFAIEPTLDIVTTSGINTSAYTALLINATETAMTGTGNKYLIDAQVGGTAKFTVTNDGTIDTDGPLYEDGTFGYMSVADSAVAQSVPNGTSYTIITAWTTEVISSGVTVDIANDRFQIKHAGKYEAKASVSFYDDTNNVVWRCAAFKNGSEQDYIHYKRKISTANDSGNAGLVGAMALSSGDTVDFRCRHDYGSPVALTVEYATFGLKYIGE